MLLTKREKAVMLFGLLSGIVETYPNGPSDEMLEAFPESAQGETQDFVIETLKGDVWDSKSLALEMTRLMVKVLKEEVES